MNVHSEKTIAGFFFITVLFFSYNYRIFELPYFRLDDDLSVKNQMDSFFVAFYFTIVTIATVGYGDISPATSYERIFCIFLMVIGVTGFTFVSGALSSIMQNQDLLVTETQEKLLHLNRIKD
jgi:hypothetical protein